MNPAPDLPGVRLDKWLWAARFYKTRSLAKQAIESGHVRYEGERAKVSREVRIGATLRLRQGFEEREVIVRALSAQRGAAPIAQQLYEETAASLEAREQARLARRANEVRLDGERPSKKQRRAIAAFKREWT